MFKSTAQECFQTKKYKEGERETEKREPTAGEKEREKMRERGEKERERN